MALFLGGRTAEKGPHMDALTPQPAVGLTEDLNSMYSLEVMRVLAAFCSCPSG